ncbi:hypothetical protein HDU82_003073, partial [Entophlyctis luteolus]
MEHSVKKRVSEKLVMEHIERFHWLALATCILIMIPIETSGAIGLLAVVFIRRLNSQNFIVWDLTLSLILGASAAIISTISAASNCLDSGTVHACLIVVTNVGHVTSVVIPVLVSFEHDALQKKKYGIKTQSFMAVLESDVLFESLKQKAIQNSTVEECIFWEACMDLERELKRPRYHKNALQVSDVILSNDEHSKVPAKHAKQISQRAPTERKEKASGSATPCLAHIERSKNYTSTGSLSSMFGSESAPRSMLSIARFSAASAPAFDWDAEVTAPSLVEKFNLVYLRFISEDAELQVNISGVCRCELEKMYSSGKWRYNAFNEAKKEVATNL